MVVTWAWGCRMGRLFHPMDTPGNALSLSSVWRREGWWGYCRSEDVGANGSVRHIDAIVSTMIITVVYYCYCMRGHQYIMFCWDDVTIMCYCSDCSSEEQDDRCRPDQRKTTYMIIPIFTISPFHSLFPTANYSNTLSAISNSDSASVRVCVQWGGRVDSWIIIKNGPPALWHYDL
jgi:hypothetical protein